MEALEHPMKAEIERLRTIVLDSDTRISEQIKWNAPSFGYDGDDRVTMKLHPPDGVRLIFHRGIKPKEDSNFTFEDDSGLLRWAAKDRAVMTFHGMPDVEANAAPLKRLVARWMQATT